MKNQSVKGNLVWTDGVPAMGVDKIIGIYQNRILVSGDCCGRGLEENSKRPWTAHPKYVSSCGAIESIFDMVMLLGTSPDWAVGSKSSYRVLQRSPGYQGGIYVRRVVILPRQSADT